MSRVIAVAPRVHILHLRVHHVARAGEFLKADTISYAPTREDYEPLFAALRSKWGWDTMYVATEEEKAASRRNNAILLAIAGSLLVAPLAFVYYLSFQC